MIITLSQPHAMCVNLTMCMNVRGSISICTQAAPLARFHQTCADSFVTEHLPLLISLDMQALLWHVQRQHSYVAVSEQSVVELTHLLSDAQFIALTPCQQWEIHVLRAHAGRCPASTRVAVRH